MWHCFPPLTAQRNRQDPLNTQVEQPTQEALLSREAMGLGPSYYKADGAEEGEVWRKTTGQDLAAFPGSLGWGENELWRYMDFCYDPRSILTMSELWQGIFRLLQFPHP